VGTGALIHRPETPECLIWLIRVPLASYLINVGHLAARSTARNIVFVVTNLDAAPGVFVIGIWTSDDKVGTESHSRETWRALDLGNLALNIADTGQIDEVKGVLSG
jgi:hypothetical protein